MKINKTSLGELVTIVGGGTPSRDRQEYYNGDIPWITVKDFDDQFFLHTSQERISQVGLDNSASRLVPAGNVILCTRMSVGKAAINIKDVAINQDLKALLCCPKLDPKYLVFYMAFISSYLESQASGATVKGITIDDVKDLEIILPSISEQQRIAKYLEKADRLRRLRRFALEMSESFLPAMFSKMFGDPVSNPMGWDKKPLREICSIRRGASPRPIEKFLNGSVPWIKIGDGTKGDRIYIKSTEECVTSEGAAKSVFLKKGTLIFANCGVSCGFARLLKIDGCIHDGWLAFEDYEKHLDPIFFLKTINQVTLYLRSLAPEGTQPNLNTGIMGDFEIIVPPMSDQKRFASVVLNHERFRCVQIESLRQVDHLFETLLHNAFNENGE